MNKNILIIGGGELQIPLIQATKNLGHTAIVSDKNPSAPGFEYADHQIIADTLDADISLQKAIEFVETHSLKIDAVVTAGTDASYTVAVIANHFKLPGHTPHAALNASNKFLMREAFQQKNISIPRYKKISSLEEGLNFFEELDGACVVKPIQNMGARGTSLVRNSDEFEAAFNLALEHNREILEILVEEYIDAKEISVDALVHNGIVTICGIGDRIIEYAPYFVETGHIMPTSLPQEWIDIAIQTFCEGIKALGLTHGAAKGDIKVSADKAWVIEIAARLSGGFMSSHTFPFATGIPLHEYMVKLALGEEITTITPTKNWVSIERAIIFPPGIIKDIFIPENLINQEYISHISLRAKVGDIVISPKNNLDKAGNIIATAPTKELAIKAINKAIYSIKVDIEQLEMPVASILAESHTKAKPLLNKTCAICPACNGIWCRGKIPGVGGVGSGNGFIHSYERMQTIKILPNYIHQHIQPDPSIKMFGVTHSMPVFAAPMGGARVNFQNALSELNLQRNIIKGARFAGTMGFMPDPAEPELFLEILQVLLENYGHCIPICKPRADITEIAQRFKQTLSMGVLGFGTDVDGIGLITLQNSHQPTSPKSIQELSALRSLDPTLSFIIKGILTEQDALAAINAGATHIIVSSHGGRIHDAFPNPIDVLPHIKEVVQDQAKILVDGSIRSGGDVVKALILGADAVLIGRPVGIHAVGGGAEAVTAYFTKIKNEIITTMTLLGVSTIDELKNRSNLILK